jgi:hypothetical protein
MCIILVISQLSIIVKCCNREIRMSNDTGKRLPMNLDGGFHTCQKETGTKKVEKKVLTLEERVKRLESIVIDPRK